MVGVLRSPPSLSSYVRAYQILLCEMYTITSCDHHLWQWADVMEVRGCMCRLEFIADLPQEFLAPGDALFILNADRRAAVDHA